jgi:hypothetical protein
MAAHAFRPKADLRSKPAMTAIIEQVALEIDLHAGVARLPDKIIDPGERRRGSHWAHKSCPRRTRSSRGTPPLLGQRSATSSQRSMPQLGCSQPMSQAIVLKRRLAKRP